MSTLNCRQCTLDQDSDQFRKYFLKTNELRHESICMSCIRLNCNTKRALLRGPRLNPFQKLPELYQNEIVKHLKDGLRPSTFAKNYDVTVHQINAWKTRGYIKL